jgi:hypothetical protein
MINHWNNRSIINQSIRGLKQRQIILKSLKAGSTTDEAMSQILTAIM